MIIGITGTKGKSTTSSIIYDIIRKSGKKAFLAGNIGNPMLSYLGAADKESIFVCEFSAHQLYGLSKSPHISVLLNIYPEHLDYYANYNEYIRSKANIAIYQEEQDYLIYNSANVETSRIAKESVAQKIAFNEYGWILNKKTNLIGGFNLENAKIGAIIGRLLGISDEVINATITGFKPLENRLEFVGNFNGIDCYNDSLSTIQESAVAAIEGLGGRVCTLIAGGFDRGQPFDKLAAAILAGNIKTLILFPTTGQKIWEEIKNFAQNTNQNDRLIGLNCYFVEDMRKAIDLVFLETEKGGICLLSSASASFGGFRDYADRGNSFKNSLVSRLDKSNQKSDNAR
jgi:UDP-N-acetylmuramoylalanine--D-glutamate ligase